MFCAARINGFWRRNRTANHRLPPSSRTHAGHSPRFGPDARLMGPFKNVARRYRAKYPKRRTRHDTMPRVYGAYLGNFPLTRVPRASIYASIQIVYMYRRTDVYIYDGDCFSKAPEAGLKPLTPPHSNANRSLRRASLRYL